MPLWIFLPLIVWLNVLVAALAVWAARSRNTVDRALALDTLATVAVAELAILAMHRGQTSYLDVALALALLSFTQTVATAKYLTLKQASGP